MCYVTGALGAVVGSMFSSHNFLLNNTQHKDDSNYPTLPHMMFFQVDPIHPFGLPNIQSTLIIN